MIQAAFALYAPLLLSAALSAQGATIQVPPGREFQQHKVLTLGLTDTWHFEAEAGEYLHCTVETSAFDPILELIGADGERLGIDDGEGSRSALRLYAPATGKLEFRVQGFDGRGGGSYRFWLQRYKTERLAASGMAEHTFGPERWWHFRVALHQGDVVVPRVPFGGRLTAVLDREQRPLPEWHGGYTMKHDGDVLLRVEGNERDRCRVEVQLARQSLLSEGGVLDGEVPAGGMDIVRHRFSPGAWAFELDTPEVELAVDLRELAPARHPRYRWMGHLIKNGRRRQWMLVHDPMDAELVLRNHGGVGSYCGRFVRVEEPLALDAAVESALPLGGGRLFELHTEPGQLLAVSLDTRAFDSQFDIWTPDGGVHSFDDSGLLEMNPQHTFLVGQRGLHRVLVYSRGGAGSGPFSLRAGRVAVSRLAVGESLPLEVRGGDAFVHLPLEVDQEVWLSVHSAAFDPGLTIRDPDGHGIGTFEAGGIDGDVLVAIKARKTGVHTLLVHARSGAGAGTLRAIAP